MEAAVARIGAWRRRPPPEPVEPVPRYLEPEQREGIREVLCQMLLLCLEDDQTGREEHRHGEDCPPPS
jgi:hypothetical protein